MTPSLGSRHANRRPTVLPSRSGGEKENAGSLWIELGSRSPSSDQALRLASSQQVTESRRQGRAAPLRRHRGRRYSFSPFHGVLRRVATAVGCVGGPRAREMARRGTCKRTAGPAAMMAPASLRFVNPGEPLPRSADRSTQPIPTLHRTLVLTRAQRAAVRRHGGRRYLLPATASLRSPRSTCSPTRLEALRLTVPARASARLARRGRDRT